VTEYYYTSQMRSRNLLALKMTKNQNKEPDYDEDEDLLEQEQEAVDNDGTLDKEATSYNDLIQLT
jgi:hypothetical protein